MQQSQYGMDFSEDNNFHFWSHAFLAYEMLSRGYSEDATRRFSAFAGAEHELRHMTENYGNAALKDVIINAYGAEFGVQMYHAKGVVPLPKVHEGPQIEDRSYHTGQGRSFHSGQGSY